jgi:hypothetical protein
MPRRTEDAARFDAQFKANPQNVDAAYDAGQAYYNLGKMDLALDPFVFDQFTVGDAHVMANETLDPKGDLYDVVAFSFYNKANKLVGVVHVESSKYGRETGVPYVLAVTTPAGHRTKNVMWKTMPPYPELKRVAIETAGSDLGIR